MDIPGYLAHLRRRDLSPSTIDAYRVRLQAWQRWCEQCRSEAPSACDVDMFLDSRGIAARARYGWISCLDGYYRWEQAEGRRDDNPTDRVVRPKLRPNLPRPISEEDLGVALELADAEMRLMLALGAFAGLRCAEIAALERSWIISSRGLLRVLGKGRRERLVPLHPYVVQCLSVAPCPRSGRLFPGLEAYQVSRRIGRHLRSLGIEATAHQLRHRFATSAYQQCQDLRVVQELLGHASPTTTAVYTAFAPTLAAEAVELIPIPR